jgi:drug/metabolite transporter (DMT)-like permease
MRDETRGMLVGFIGVLIFSLTLPMVKIAGEVFSPAFIAFGRAALAGVVAMAWLAWRKPGWPSRAVMLRLALIAAGIVWGFPLLIAQAMVAGASAHGAVVLGILPLATTALGVIRAGERPSTGFWIMSVLGSALVLAYALIQGHGRISSVDLLLVGACLASAVGYSEGAMLSRSMDSREVISWTLALSLPVNLIAVAWLGWPDPATVNPAQWAAFLYNGLFSMYVGFFFWYAGLAHGGIARVSQVQLLQPFCTLGAGALLLGEPITLTNVGFALAVVGVVAAGRQMSVGRQAG